MPNIFIGCRIIIIRDWQFDRVDEMKNASLSFSLDWKIRIETRTKYMIKVENKEIGMNADNNILRNTGARLTFQRFLESFPMKMHM